MSLARILRRWALPVVLAAVALVSWEAADRANFDPVDISDETYDRTLATPMLSARRLPHTLRAPVSDELIGAAIDQVGQGLDTTQVCVVVRNGDRFLGQVRDPGTGLVPASNQKLITTWAGLELLGPDFRFTTRVVAPTGISDGVVDGDLYLVGGGDPFLVTDDWLTQYQDIDGRHHTRLEDLADDVAAAGVTSITGSVIGDESLFDDQRYGPWDNRLIVQKQSGPLSALTVNEGFEDWPDVFRESYRPRNDTDNPPLYGASVFNQLLQERAISVGGAPAAGQAPASAGEIASIQSPPLSEVITHINSFSSNIGAELLLKRIGVEVAGLGTTSAGAAAVTDLLAQHSIPMQGVLIFDGSGLSEDDRLTCSALAAVLTKAGPETPLGRSLAIGGVRGSLDQRFIDSPATGLVLAKTGTLRGSRALSGYVLSAAPGAEGQFVTFAQILNDEDIVDDDTVAAVQEPLVETLVGYPSGPSIEELSPRAPIPG